MILSKANLAIAALASKDPSRPNIRGVLVTPGGTVATNGHMLGVVCAPPQDWPSEPALDPCVLPVESVTTLAKLVDARSPMPSVSIDTTQSNANGALIAQASGTPVRVPKADPAEVTFPDWHAILPTTPARATAGLNPALLETIAKLLRQNGAKAIEIELRGDGEPVVIRDRSAGREQDSLYIIAQLRI